jgi:hypothetical protein
LAIIATDIQATNNKVETDLETRLSSLEENSEDYLLKVPYKEQIDNYLPVFPKYLCTSSNASANGPKLYTLFKFYNVANSGSNYPRVNVNTYDSANDTLFDINRSTNNIQVGAFTSGTGTVKVGGQNLELYSNNKIKLIFGTDSNIVNLNSSTTDFTIKRTTTSPIRYFSISIGFNCFPLFI